MAPQAMKKLMQTDTGLTFAQFFCILMVTMTISVLFAFGIGVSYTSYIVTNVPETLDFLCNAIAPR